MPQEPVTVYFDYLCPYAWRAAALTASVEGPLGLRFEWVHFSLYQSNRPNGDGWQLWNERLDERDDAGTMGLLPFLASTAARRQGPAPHDAFRTALLHARHVEHRPFHLSTMMEAAEEAHLHLACFERDLADPEARTALAREHHRGVAAEVFGTPTFGFPSGDTAYVRLRQVPADQDDAVELFERIRGMLADYPYLETLKRPRHGGN